MSSYVVLIRVVGHTQNKRESAHEEAELLEHAKLFVEELIGHGHNEIVGELRIDGASPIDLVPVEEEEAEAEIPPLASPRLPYNLTSVADLNRPKVTRKR